MSFEANSGQTDAQVKFLARGNGFTLFLTAAEAVFASKEPRGVMRLRLVGGGLPTAITGFDPMSAKSHYFLGNDSNKWRTGVATFARVKYESVYPGIDLVYHGNPQQLEYDFDLAAGADPNAIRLRFDGADDVRIEQTGDLLVHIADRQVRQHKPIVYQQSRTGRESISGGYALTADGDVSFQIGEYDHSRPLVIDPVLVYSSYLGGSSPHPFFGGDQGWGIAVDPDGNAYVTGQTQGVDFPTVNPIQPTLAGGVDAFITKVSADGSALIYSTYFGGSDSDNFSGEGGIAVDAVGNVFITGSTASNDFPTTAGAFRGTAVGVFVTKLNPTGSALVYSAILGIGEGRGIAIDSLGNAYVTGRTSSATFPTVHPYQSTLRGPTDAFVAKLNAAGSALMYSTFLGGFGPGGSTSPATAVGPLRWTWPETLTSPAILTRSISPP